MKYNYEEIGNGWGLKTRNILNQNLKNIESDMREVNGRVDTIVTESGNSNLEVADARGAYTTLKARLDASQADLQIESDKIEDLQTNVDNHTSRLEDIAISVKSYGAVGDGVTNTNDTQAIKDAISAAQAFSNPTLIFPKAVKYNTTETITIPPNINVIMDAPIEYQGSSNIPALVVGSSTTSMRTTLKLNVMRKTQSDWLDENCIGIKIINANSCDITIVRAQKFTIGVQFIGSNGGFSYNEVKLLYVYDNKVAIDCANEAGGWINENNYYGGRLSNGTTTNTGLSRYGVRITSKDGAYTNNNNNVFYKPSFELKVPTTGEAIPILIEYGKNNSFLNLRNENNSTTTARIINDSVENVITTGYGICVIDDQSTSPTTYNESANAKYKNNAKGLVFSSGAMHKNACYYDGATQINIPNVHIGASANASIFKGQSSVTLNDNYVELTSSRSVGVFMKTTSSKSFLVRKDTENGYGGRVAVRCYDSMGNILTSAGVGHPYVKGTATQIFTYTTNSGGSYRTGSDTNGDTFFTVGADVDYVCVILIGITNPMRIRSFSILSSNNDCAVWTGYEEIVKGVNLGTAPPTTGNWKKGKVILNDNKTELGSTGSKYVIESWECITDGTPGTWIPKKVLTGN